jgi:hypothetical protein
VDKHSQVLPALFNLLNDSSSFVRMRSLMALDAFCTDLGMSSQFCISITGYLAKAG